MAKAAGKLPLPPPSTSAPLLDSTVARRVYPPAGVRCLRTAHDISALL